MTPQVIYSTEYGWLKDQIESAADAFATELAGLAGSRPIPDHDWSVAQLGSHVAQMPEMYRSFADPLTRPTPERFDEARIKSISLADEMTAAELADKVRVDFARWLDELGSDASAPMAWWIPTTAHGIAGAALGELLLHHDDLGRLTGRGVELTKQQGIAIIEGVLPAASAFAKPDVAAGCQGIFHLKIRGATDWTMTVEGTDLEISQGQPPKADVHFNVDPVSFVRASYGRANVFVESLLGRQLAYGRKPWLALRFNNLIDAP